VPTRFQEGYHYGPKKTPGSAVQHERIVCQAEYSNYRRFETSVRVK
jgi:hypothetical protein